MTRCRLSAQDVNKETRPSHERSFVRMMFYTCGDTSNRSHDDVSALDTKIFFVVV